MALSNAQQPLVYRALSETPAMRMLGFLLLALAGALLITVSAQIKVPFIPVPMTMQTLAVFVIAAAYGLRLGAATVALYLAQGAIGLPVFTGGAGLAYLAGPTGGFLIGFLAAVIIIGFAVDRGWGSNPLKLFGATLIGAIVLMALGFAWLAGIIGVEKAWVAGVQPFLLGELTKVILASALIPAATALLTRK